MGVRIAESWTAPNGRRYSVSMSLRRYVAGKGIWGALAFTFLALWWCLLFEFWVCAELALVTVTGALTIGAVLNREAKPADITLLPLKWHLYMIGLKGARH